MFLTRFLDDRVVGPPTQYGALHTGGTSVDVDVNTTLEEHACQVMDAIEDELIAKMHASHVRKLDGISPYNGRSKGLVVTEQESDGNTGKSIAYRHGPLRTMQLTQQAIARTIVAVKLFGQDLIKYGDNSVADKAAYVMISNTDMTRMHDFDCDQPPYEQLLNWFNDMARGQGAEVSSLRVLHDKICCYHKAC